MKHFRLHLLSLLAAIIAVPANALAAEPPFAVVGYLPSYRLKEVDPAKLVGLTHLVYFGYRPSEFAASARPDIAKEALVKLREISAATKCRILVTIGGWGRSEGFAEIAGDEGKRERFVTAVRSYCLENGFAGVDYDWEHPKGAVEIANYAKLIVETGAAFKAKGMEVTVAQAGWQDLGKSVYGGVDRVHLMSYDHDFPQATLEKSNADLERLASWGCPPGKIALGLPFYGRNKTRQARAYGDLLAAAAAAAGNDAGDLIDGYALNGKETIVAKTELALKRGLAGVMIWELAQDSPDESTSLLRAIGERVRLDRFDGKGVEAP